MSRNESDTHNKDAADEHREWLELSKLANVEVSSEQPEHPAASVLMPITELGWQATNSGPQTLRIIFHRSERIRRLHLEFNENELART